METILTWIMAGLTFLWFGFWKVVKGWFLGHIALLKMLGGGDASLIIFLCLCPFIFYYEYKLIKHIWKKIDIAIYRMKPVHCQDCGCSVKNGNTYCPDCQKKRNDNKLAGHRKEFQDGLALAKQYETMGRFEESARIYEYLAEGRLKPDGQVYFIKNPEYFEEAGRVRKLARTEYVKESHVNLNQLLSDLKEYVNYKCPNCGSGIGISSKTSPDGLKFCAHCGSGLNTQVIMDFLKAL